MPPHAECVGRDDGRMGLRRVGRQVRRKGHFKSAGSRNQAGCYGGFPRLGVNTSRANPWLELVRAGELTRRLIAARGTRVHRMRQPSYRPLAEERLNERK